MKTINENEIKTGKKYDVGKPDWSLVPANELEDIVKVFTMGSQKYGRENWKNLPDGMFRCYSAMMRHIRSYKKWTETGDSKDLYDEESGLHHLAHAATNILFMMWWDNNNAHIFEEGHMPLWLEQIQREMEEEEGIDLGSSTEDHKKDGWVEMGKSQTFRMK